jgi:hypothetical protein
MKGRRLLTLSVLVVALGCQDQNSPTAPLAAKAPPTPSSMISDGAHGGNPDFFFLPPMVSNPVNDPNYEAGKFNATLGPRLTVEVCLLQGPPVNALGVPVATDCVVGAPVKKFAAGTVQLVGMPDGHYQVLWKTRESNLDVTKYYRIRVLIEGSVTEPGLELGFADIDPMENKSQVKNTRTGEVIALVDDSTLPIKFRVEKGALCNPGETLCTSTIITNHTPNGEPQIVQLLGSDGSAIAGVLIPDGFLPETGPQSVVLTIDRVNTGVNNVAAGTQSIPCHANVPLQQFNSCFRFSTIPKLDEINEERHQFLKALTVAVCFVLHDTEDPREPWVQLWSSEEGGADAKPLRSAPATQILAGPGGEGCGENLAPPIASNFPSNEFTRFASAGWKKLTGGLGQFFGVKTAYAIDVGLGGLAFDLSNIGPAMTASMRPGPGAPTASVEVGETTTLVGRIVGTQTHDGSALSTGISNLPIVFALGEESAAGLRLLGSEAPLSSQVTGLTNLGIIFPGSEGSGGGFVSVNWTAPMTPGEYTVIATSPYAIGTVTYNLTVRPAALIALQGTWVNENPATLDITTVVISVEGSSVSINPYGQCSPVDCDWGSSDGGTTGWTTGRQVTGSWDFGFKVATQTITWLSANRIQVATHNDYTVADGRTDYTITEFFTKEEPIP